jgi:hypothetical protein
MAPIISGLWLGTLLPVLMFWHWCARVQLSAARCRIAITDRRDHVFSGQRQAHWLSQPEGGLRSSPPAPKLLHRNHLNS